MKAFYIAICNLMYCLWSRSDKVKKHHVFVVTRVREFYTVKMAVTFASDSADLILTWYSGEVFQGER